MFHLQKDNLYKLMLLILKGIRFKLIESLGIIFIFEMFIPNAFKAFSENLFPKRLKMNNFILHFKLSIILSTITAYSSIY